MAWLRLLFIVLIVRPLALVLTGVDVIGRERLPTKGPAIVAGNHNSHVDTLLLLAMFPPRALARVRPVAAADYFLKEPALAWFALNIIGIVPVERASGQSGARDGVDVLAGAKAALARGDILVIFPEGTRGEAGHRLMAPMKTGVARLAEDCPEAPVCPVWIQGAGRVLPKGAILPVPMNCRVLVGDPIHWAGGRDVFMAELKAAFDDLEAKAPPLRWRETD
jgi:1-acyl-sn-glycerol-3-phosphate acyltransferase